MSISIFQHWFGGNNGINGQPLFLVEQKWVYCKYNYMIPANTYYTWHLWMGTYSTKTPILCPFLSHFTNFISGDYQWKGSWFFIIYLWFVCIIHLSVKQYNAISPLYNYLFLPTERLWISLGSVHNCYTDCCLLYNGYVEFHYLNT